MDPKVGSYSDSMVFEVSAMWDGVGMMGMMGMVGMMGMMA